MGAANNSGMAASLSRPAGDSVHSQQLPLRSSDQTGEGLYLPNLTPGLQQELIESYGQGSM